MKLTPGKITRRNLWTTPNLRCMIELKHHAFLCQPTKDDKRVFVGEHAGSTKNLKMYRSQDRYDQFFLRDRLVTPSKENKIVGSVTILYGSLPCLAWQIL